MPATDRSGSCCRVGAGRRLTSPTGRALRHEQTLEHCVSVCAPPPLHLLLEARQISTVNKPVCPLAPEPSMGNTPEPQLRLYTQTAPLHTYALPWQRDSASVSPCLAAPQTCWRTALAHAGSFYGHLLRTRPWDSMGNEAATTCSLRELVLTLSLFQSSILIQDPCRCGTGVRGQVIAQVT